MTKKSFLDTEEEWLIERYGQGVKLITHQPSGDPPKHAISQIMQLLGIFGVSILTGNGARAPLANTLASVIQTRLLGPPSEPNVAPLAGLQDKKIHYSKQETDILFHLVRGKTAKEIGKLLGLSHRTIEHRLEKIKIKAAVSSKSELIEKMFDKFK